MANYEAVIGLEIHAQLSTESKLFCTCPAGFGGGPNEHVCEVCSGMPGALPRLNEKAVELAAQAGYALNCRVNDYSLFSRKNYFYPDLPGGYQTSQYDPPICERGHLDIEVDGQAKRIGITRIHMEDDAGKCVHGQGGQSLVDLNRQGTALIEIVSDPDMRSAAEAAAFMREVHAILTCMDVTDGNMEEGNFRCDANVSIRPKGRAAFGTRAEIKNLNSFRNVQKAIEYEISRQKACIEDGDPIVQETRLFDSAKQITLSMRSKEDAHDYRYFPNPDLPPVIIDHAQKEAWFSRVPELPSARKRRFVDKFGLSEEDAALFAYDKHISSYFEEAVNACNEPKRIAALMNSEFLRECSSSGILPPQSKMTPARLGELAKIIDQGLISLRTAHDIFPDLFSSGGSPEEYVREKSLAQVSDAGELEKAVLAAIEENPAEAAAYKDGKTKLLSFFVGQVMRKTAGKANPALVNSLLQEKLK